MSYRPTIIDGHSLRHALDVAGHTLGYGEESIFTVANEMGSKGRLKDYHNSGDDYSYVCALFELLIDFTTSSAEDINLFDGIVFSVRHNHKSSSFILKAELKSPAPEPSYFSSDDYNVHHVEKAFSVVIPFVIGDIRDGFFSVHNLNQDESNFAHDLWSLLQEAVVIKRCLS